MSKENFFCGYPVEFKKLCLIYPPKVRDILTNQKARVYHRLLTFSQEEIEDEFVKNQLDLTNLLTPFEYILNNAYNNSNFESLLKESFDFFLHEPVTFLYEQKMIIIGAIKEIKTVKELRILRETDYFEFQNLIREAMGGKTIDPPIENEHPRIKAMKAKARYRDKIKAEKGGGLNLLSSLASICCMNLGLNPLNIGELSYAAVSTLIRIYQNKEKYELDIKSLLAGADHKKVQPIYWLKNLEE